MANTDRVKEVFAEAMQLPAEKRAAFVANACAGDDVLRAEVEALLRAGENADDAGFFESPTHDAPTRDSVERSVHVPITEGPGTRIGPYKLLQLIGEGGFGSVFMAEQEKPVRRRVALKIIKLGMDTKQVIARFEAERQALAMMDHPNIARVLDAGATDTGRPYFVMELVKGDPITTYCDRNNLSIAARLALLAQVCTAVQHAHTKGIIHRDIKPTNILVSMQDGRPFAKVIDFGIAKATSARLTERTLFTEHQQLIGTPEYMSPEQAEGSLDIDTRTDVYSLGVLMYELLTGTTPFDPRTLRSAAYAEIQRIIREVTPPKPSTRLSQSADMLSSVAAHRHTEPKKLGTLIRGDLDWIVMKALEKDRARRYETANGFADDIRRYLNDEPVKASPPSTSYKLKKLVKRHRGAVTAVAAVFGILVLGIIGIALALNQAVEARGRFAAEATKSTQIAGFFQDMLGSIKPAVALGKDTELLRQLLDDTAQSIAVELRDQPDVEAAIRVTMGGAYRTIGEYDEAESQFDRAIEIMEDRIGADHPDTHMAKVGLATVYYDQARYDDAEAEYLQSIPPLERALGRDDSEVLRYKVNLAQLYIEQGRLPEGEAELARLRDRFDSLGRLDDPLRLRCLSGLASLYRMQGKMDQAEPLVLEVLERSERTLSPEHPDTIAAMHNLATMYASQGRLEEAEPLMERAIEGRKRVFGVDHPMTLSGQRNLATIYWHQKRFAEAETLLLEIIEKQKARLKGDHPDTISSMQLLAVIYSMDGRHAEAEKMYRDLLDIGRRVQGERHPDTLITMANLARLLATVGRHAEAEPLLEVALEEYSAQFGEEHQHSQMIANLLLSVYRAQDKSDEVHELMRRRKEREQQHCDRPDATAADLNGCAWHLLTYEPESLREPERALKLAQRACELEEEAGGNNLWVYLDTLALAQHTTGDTATAIETQRRVLELMPEDDANREECADRLAEFEAALASADGSE